MTSQISTNARKEPNTPALGYGVVFFDKEEMIYKIKHDNGSVSPLEVTPNENIRIVNANIDSGVAEINTPVYFDGISNSWKKATSTTPRPTGMVGTNFNEVVLFGKLRSFGLYSNKYYFLKTGGGITIDEAQTYVKIGYSLDSETMLVDIDVESNISTPPYVPSYTGQSIGIGTLTFNSLFIQGDLNTPYNVWSGISGVISGELSNVAYNLSVVNSSFGVNQEMAGFRKRPDLSDGGNKMLIVKNDGTFDIYDCTGLAPVFSQTISGSFFALPGEILNSFSSGYVASRDLNYFHYQVTPSNKHRIGYYRSNGAIAGNIELPTGEFSLGNSGFDNIYLYGASKSGGILNRIKIDTTPPQIDTQITMQGVVGYISSVVVGNGYIAGVEQRMASADNKVVITNLDGTNPTVINTPNAYNQNSSLAYNSNNNMLYVGAQNTIFVIDMTTKTLAGSLTSANVTGINIVQPTELTIDTYSNRLYGNDGGGTGVFYIQL